jgi:hypothetical protein
MTISVRRHRLADELKEGFLVQSVEVALVEPASRALRCFRQR